MDKEENEMKNQEKQNGVDYIVYTDGGCAVNPGDAGGCAAIVMELGCGELKEFCKGFVSTTNNRMEMMAVVMALEEIDQGHVLVYSDSAYVVNTMNGQYVKKKNVDLWKRLEKACRGKRVAFEWVRGHSGNSYNERCDQFCLDAMNGLYGPLLRDEEFENLNGGHLEFVKESAQQSLGTMGTSIHLPEKFLNFKKPVMSIDEYCEVYQVKKECAKKILEFYRLKRPAFKNYLSLKTGGIDHWSRTSKEKLIEETDDGEEIWDLICNYFGEEEDVITCLRWYKRGLALSDCIRKQFVANEVRYNYFNKK